MHDYEFFLELSESICFYLASYFINQYRQKLISIFKLNGLKYNLSKSVI